MTSNSAAAENDKINGNGEELRLIADKVNGEEEEKNAATEVRDEEATFADEFLQRHNELRKVHGSPDLTLSGELCEMAAKWANKIAGKGHVTFAEMSGIGENLTVFPGEMAAREMVDYWYEEHRKYEYDTPGWQEGTNYFTQIVWRSTKEVGVSRVQMRQLPAQFAGKKKEEESEKRSEEEKHRKETSDLVVVAAFYRPAGNSNRSGQFMLNVSPPLGTLVGGKSPGKM